MTVIIFIIVLAVLIFVHELGHFLAARACGIRVDSFKIGFGPKIVAWRFKDKHGTPGETEYGINWIPFGGYVKIFGENGEHVPKQGTQASCSFAHKPRWQQIIVLAAGVFFNFLFAWLLYAGVFNAGVTASIDSFPQYVDRFSDPRVMITDILPNSPADKAGLQVGDTITSIGGMNVVPASVNDNGETITMIQTAVNETKGQSIMLGLVHDNVSESIALAPTSGLVAGKYAIGIAMDDVGDLKLPFFTAVGESFNYTIDLIQETASGLYNFVAQIFEGQPDFSQVAGPVGIAGIVGDAAKMGFIYLVMVTAVISINLGVINLIPFPALDGGRIFFAIIESIIRRPIPAKFTNAVNTVGFILLMLLMVAVTFQDVMKLVG